MFDDLVNLGLRLVWVHYIYIYVYIIYVLYHMSWCIHQIIPINPESISHKFTSWWYSKHPFTKRPWSLAVPIPPSCQVQELFAQPGEVCLHRAICAGETWNHRILYGFYMDFKGFNGCYMDVIWILYGFYRVFAIPSSRGFLRLPLYSSCGFLFTNFKMVSSESRNSWRKF